MQSCKVGKHIPKNIPLMQLIHKLSLTMTPIFGSTQVEGFGQFSQDQRQFLVPLWGKQPQLCACWEQKGSLAHYKIYDYQRHNYFIAKKLILSQKHFCDKFFLFHERRLTLVVKSFCNKFNVSPLIVYRDIIFLLSPIIFFDEKICC